MIERGPFCPIGGTHPSQGWDINGTPGLISFISLYILHLLLGETYD